MVARRHIEAHQLPLDQLLEFCPFRSLIGLSHADNQADEMEEMLNRIGGVIAVMGEEIESLSERMMADAGKILAADKVVLLLSNRKDLRDAAKAEINLRFMPPASRV